MAKKIKIKDEALAAMEIADTALAEAERIRLADASATRRAEAVKAAEAFLGLKTSPGDWEDTGFLSGLRLMVDDNYVVTCLPGDPVVFSLTSPDIEAAFPFHDLASMGRAFAGIASALDLRREMAR